MRLLIVKPEALLDLLLRAEHGESAQDLMFEALDIAQETVVNMEVEETDG